MPSLFLYDNMIIFFTKAPALGFGKSRLKEILSDEDILKLNKKLIKDNYDIIREYEHVIYYDGALSDLSFLDIDRNVRVIAQYGDGLGERMKNAIYAELKDSRSILLTGSDLTGLDSNLIDEAFLSLSKCDAVITPTYDGGYGLIGMKEKIDLFSDITYSTNMVYLDVINRATAFNKSITSIGRLDDVDSFCDIIRAELGGYYGELEEIGRGEYNINYLYYDSEHGKSVFRINLDSQLGLGKEQIAYEFNALRELQSSGVTPRAYYYKTDGYLLPYGYLTMEYLSGRALDYKTDLEIAARLLANVHNVDIKNSKLIRADKPFQVMYDEFLNMYGVYQEWSGKSDIVTTYIDRFMHAISQDGLDDDIINPVIINTELNNRNFIIGEKSFIIDWEKPIIGEAEQDLAHFMVPTTTNWKTDVILDDDEMDFFINEYERYRKVDRNRLKKYLRFNCLRGITWCAMAKVEYSSDRGIKNMDTLAKIDKFLSEDFLRMLEYRFFKEIL
ncbi:MAG: DUF2064 domain-containing protein [Ezakiella sp.]|nr:DUF2064 domain-containing protein [Ezakiella sp.]